MNFLYFFYAQTLFICFVGCIEKKKKRGETFSCQRIKQVDSVIKHHFAAVAVTFITQNFGGVFQKVVSPEQAVSPYILIRHHSIKSNPASKNYLDPYKAIHQQANISTVLTDSEFTLRIKKGTVEHSN